MVPSMSLTDEEKAGALAHVPLFEGISFESMTRLAAVTGEQDFAAGQFIVRQGQIGTGLYIVVNGTVRVLRGSDQLAELGPGDFFGELAVIDQQPRNASVQAISDTRCLALASWDLLQLLQNDTALSLNLIRGLVERVRDQGEHHRH
jgi:CRP-like cAMP-binding protein